MNAIPDGLPPSLILPPIDHVPVRAKTPASVLPGFVDAGTRPWRDEPVAVPGAVSVCLGVELVASTGFGGWLLWSLLSGTPCTGFVCGLVTLGGHVVLLLILSAVCLLTLGGAAVVTGGLRRVSVIPMTAVVVGALAGAVTVSGLVVLVLLGSVVVGVVGAVLATMIDRI